ncbi:MAG: hypothetical protein GXX96_01580 [Planctomycetaceae bacterium]|nr:hypothetical protein [Planctomycetaceae bacterium]
MKPTIIIAVSLITVTVIAVGSLQFHRSQPSEDPGMPKYVPFSESAAPVADAPAPAPADSTPNRPTPETPAETDTSPISPATSRTGQKDCLTLLSVAERRLGQFDDHDKRAWRVEVKNESDQNRYCYVEVEWLDEAGSHVDGAHTLRRIAPGTCSISVVHPMAPETAARAKSIRVVELQTRSTPADE